MMAASVGMRSVLIEPDALCAKLKHVAAVNNVVGGHASGPELAAAIAGDVERAELCEVELGARVTGLRAFTRTTWSSRQTTGAPSAPVTRSLRPGWGRFPSRRLLG